MNDQLKREVRFWPAWDRRDPDPRKNYGIGSVKVAFILVGPEGAIHFALLSGWCLPGIPDDPEPFPYGVFVHSPVPSYEDQPVSLNMCEWLGGRDCYLDDIPMQARDIFEVLLRQGDEGVWAELEKCYHQVFGE